MKHSLLCFMRMLCLTMLIGCGLAHADPLGVPDAVIDDVLTRNSALQADLHRWQNYDHRISSAQALADPQLSLALSNYPSDNFRSDRSAMTGKEIRLSQAVPFPGKRAQRGSIAQQQAVWFQQLYQDRRFELLGEIRQQFFELWYLDKAVDINRHNIGLMQQLVEMAQQRYRTGQGEQTQIFDAQLALSQLEDERITLSQRHIAQQAKINRLREREPLAPIAVPKHLPIAAINHSYGELTEIALSQRPKSQGYSALQQSYRHQSKLAHLDFFPDATFGISYRQREATAMDDGVDFVGAEVRFTLPVNRRVRDEAIAQAQSGLHMVEAQTQDYRTTLQQQIFDLCSQLNRLKQQQELYRNGLLEQSQAAYDAAVIAYRGDRGDFDQVLQRLLGLQRHQLSYYQILSRYQGTLSQLLALTALPETELSTATKESL